MAKFLNREIGQRYLPKEWLGEGAHAEVYRAYDSVRRAYVALKIFHQNAFDAQQAEAARHFEVWEGSAVLPLWEVHPEYLEGEITVMPIMPGTLADRGDVFASEAVHYARRIATALEFCHGRGVVHGDVKPSNAFLNEQGAVLLGDFGVRDFIPGGRRGHTLEYAAPELVKGTGRSPATDVWAAAVLLYELLCGAVPFGARNGDSEEAIAKRIEQCVYTHPDRVRPYLSLRLRRLFKRCFVPDPGRREIKTAGELRTALKDIRIGAEWIRYGRDGYEMVWEGHELDSEGRRTGTRFEAALRYLPKLDVHEAVIARDGGSGLRRITGVQPFRGSQAKAIQQIVTWMRQLVENRPLKK